MPTDPERTGEPAPDEDEEYPAGSETPSEPAGVGEGVEEGDQPGLADDPPQTD